MRVTVCDVFFAQQLASCLEGFDDLDVSIQVCNAGLIIIFWLAA